MDANDKLMSESDAADMLCISLSTLRRDRAAHGGARHAGQGIPFVRIAGAVRYQREGIIRWIQANTLNPVEDAPAAQPDPARRGRGRPRKTAPNDF